MPCALIRACRAIVCSQSSGEKCQALRIRFPGHPGLRPPAVRLRQELPVHEQARIVHRRRQAGLPNQGSRRSASAADLTPSATSASAGRSRAESLIGPLANSSARCGIEHLPRCTASATTARTSFRSVIGRTASATARGGRANRASPETQNPAGNRPVRCSRANPASARRLATGTKTSTRLRRSVASPAVRTRRQAVPAQGRHPCEHTAVDRRRAAPPSRAPRRPACPCESGRRRGATTATGRRHGRGSTSPGWSSRIRGPASREITPCWRRR